MRRNEVFLTVHREIIYPGESMILRGQRAFLIYPLNISCHDLKWLDLSQPVSETLPFSSLLMLLI